MPLKQSDIVESAQWLGQIHRGWMTRSTQPCENEHIQSKIKSKRCGHMGGKNLYVAIIGVVDRICT